MTYFSQIQMGWNDPPKRPYQYEPKRCYNTEDYNLHLSVF